MHPNQELLTRFYEAFKQRDYAGMQACYSNEARFSDAVFVNLNCAETKAMWEMLCKNGQDLELSYSHIWANEEEGKARWVAHYTFSKTGKKVTNRIEASFKFKNGLIANHVDYFSFYGWAGQAMGITGLLLGWTPFFKEKVRGMARKSLAKFMNKH